jgi:hypothetical protein
MKKVLMSFGGFLFLSLIFIGFNGTSIFAEEVEVPEDPIVETEPVECEGPYERGYQKALGLGLGLMQRKELGELNPESPGLGQHVRAMARQHRETPIE